MIFSSANQPAENIIPKLILKKSAKNMQQFLQLRFIHKQPRDV